MVSHSHKRGMLFFLVAVLLPCSVLVAIGLRMISQERELAEKRLADERRRVLSDIHQQLLAHLEQIKLEELAALPARPDGRLRAGQVSVPPGPHPSMKPGIEYVFFGPVVVSSGIRLIDEQDHASRRLDPILLINRP